MVRLNFPPLNEALYDRYSTYKLGDSTGLYNIFLQSSDYVYFFTENLMILFYTSILIGIVWMALAIKDKKVAK